MTKTSLERLEETFEAILERDVSWAALKRAAGDLFDSEPSWLQPLIRQWTVERLSAELRRKSAARARALQLTLPGFENLPRSIPERDGRRKRLLDATLRDLVDYRKSFYKRWKGNQKREQIERLIALMRQHKDQGIKVSEVLRLEGIEPRLPEPE